MSIQCKFCGELDTIQSRMIGTEVKYGRITHVSEDWCNLVDEWVWKDTIDSSFEGFFCDACSEETSDLNDIAKEVKDELSQTAIQK